MLKAIWLHRNSRQIRQKKRKRPILHHTCVTWSELTSYISTMLQPLFINQSFSYIRGKNCQFEPNNLFSYNLEISGITYVCLIVCGFTFLEKYPFKQGHAQHQTKKVFYELIVKYCYCMFKKACASLCMIYLYFAPLIF